MKKLVNRYSFFAIIIISLGFQACNKDIPVAQDILILSYNVAGLPEGLSGSRPATYTSLISPLLNSFDIVHVQEDFCYHDSLILFNNHPYRTLPSPCVPDGDGLNTFSRFPITDFIRIPWNHCYGSDCFTPKGFSFSRIEIVKGRFIDFYNVHCNAGSSAPNLEARRGNIAQLTSYISQHSESNAVVVMGDFNSRYTREGDTIRAMMDLGFKDVWVDVVRFGDIPGYGAKLDDCSPIGTNIQCEGVDKMFYRSNTNIEITATKYKHGDDRRFLYMNNDTLPLSDHVPSVAGIRISFKN